MIKGGLAARAAPACQGGSWTSLCTRVPSVWPGLSLSPGPPFSLSPNLLRAARFCPSTTALPFALPRGRFPLPRKEWGQGMSHCTLGPWGTPLDQGRLLWAPWVSVGSGTHVPQRQCTPGTTGNPAVLQAGWELSHEHTPGCRAQEARCACWDRLACHSGTRSSS